MVPESKNGLESVHTGPILTHPKAAERDPVRRFIRRHVAAFWGVSVMLLLMDTGMASAQGNPGSASEAPDTPLQVEQTAEGDESPPLPVETTPPPELQMVPETEEVPLGPTAEEQILAPLEAGPTAEEQILAPLEVVETTGDVLEGVGPREYVVQEGDTLWDITQTHFADNFLWPKVWKHNKSILDPDLIYPGNIILIPGELGAPVPQPGMPAPAAPQPAAPRVEQPIRKTTEEAVPQERRIEIVLPEVTSPQNFSLDLSTLPNPGYLVTKEERVGKIVGARDGRNLLGEGETVYLHPTRGRRPNIGDRFTVYRVVRKVDHPKTGERIGKLLQILGTVEVTHSKPKEKTQTARIVDSLDYIQSGDFMMPLILRETSRSVSYSTRPENPLEGVILDVKELRILQAEHDLVFLDRGRQHGLKIGNRFTIIRDGDRTPLLSPGRGVRLPSRTIGQLQVISVQDVTATAMILRSTEAILRGDRFETPPRP